MFWYLDGYKNIYEYYLYQKNIHASEKIIFLHAVFATSAHDIEKRFTPT